jgi:hypothetical protein
MEYNILLGGQRMKIDYLYIFNDTIKYYLGDKFHWPFESRDKVTGDIFEPASTIDDYIVSLMKGYMNADIEERLERYILEVIKDDCFHKWPLVRWAYATRILYNHKSTQKDLKCAVEILIALSEDGYPCAIGDLAYCYRYGVCVGRSYEKAICLGVMASKKGYKKAHDFLKLEYDLSCSKELPEELRLLLVNRILWLFIEENNIPVVNCVTYSVVYPDNLPEKVDKTLRRIYNEHKRLCKATQDKAYMRHCGQLCWSSEENPYNIGIKVKER